MTNYVNQAKYQSHIDTTSFCTYVTVLGDDGKHVVCEAYKYRPFNSMKAAERSVTKFIHSQEIKV